MSRTRSTSKPRSKAGRSAPDRSVAAMKTQEAKPALLLQIRNRQLRQAIDLRVLKTILRGALDADLGVRSHEVCVHLVGADEMTSVNETFLQHEGSTDVITFNHREPACPEELHGELFVCVDEAVELAARFRSTWAGEVVRYAIHGFLHLQGHDDREPAARRRMKRAENRVMRALRNRFTVERIGSRLRRVP